mgnify:CR=1 FL=1
MNHLLPVVDKEGQAPAVHGHAAVPGEPPGVRRRQLHRQDPVLRRQGGLHRRFRRKCLRLV